MGGNTPYAWAVTRAYKTFILKNLATIFCENAYNEATNYHAKFETILRIFFFFAHQGQKSAHGGKNVHISTKPCHKNFVWKNFPSNFLHGCLE